MKRLMLVVLAGGIGLGACQSAPVDRTPDATLPAPQPTDASAIPSRTELTVELQAPLNTTATRVGDTFTVTVVEPLVATNNQVVIPEGSAITGMVTGVGAVRDDQPAAIRLNFLRISVNNVSHPLTAEVLSTHLPGAPEPVEPAPEEAVDPSVPGSVITGDLRDALIGAALGAGAGTIISLGRGGDVEAVLPQGTHMNIRTVGRVQLR